MSTLSSDGLSVLQLQADADQADNTIKVLIEENDRLKQLAHHLRQCRDCGEMDVNHCHQGRQLWETAMGEKS